MKPKDTDVGEFFDSIADNYKDKYSDKDRFLEYFFTERLDESTRGIQINGKRILDIGAGTGNLYDHLVQSDADVDYYALDISAEMLAQSSIPHERRFVGKVAEVELPVPEFDLIFMLGVTTYIGGDEIGVTVEKLLSLLKSGGTAVVSFTNNDSLDWKTRRIVKSFGRRLLPGRAVLGQNFTVYARSVPETLKLLGIVPEKADIRWLNHTVFPFNRLFKNVSVRLAKKIHKRPARHWLMRRLSSDFLVIFTKE